jgi:dihydroorotate dehydrogenase electron transfer subunit
LSGAPARAAATRGTIYSESARIIAQTGYEGAQYVLRLLAPRVAEHATPGSFVHLCCAAELPMRRPLSIMRVHRSAGSIELLYKVMGSGTAALARQPVGAELAVLGPIGRGFIAHPARPRVLAIGGGVGIPPMVFLAEQLQSDDPARWKTLVLMGSEIPFPFRARPSRILVPGIDPGAIGCMPELDALGIASRLASRQGYPGCFDGLVTDLARQWLCGLEAGQRAEVEVFACGPTPMLRAAAKLAAEYQLPAQVCLEEFMACAVGGCAGCAVRVQTESGPAMKRVCVDGPVFEAAAVFG